MQEICKFFDSVFDWLILILSVDVSLKYCSIEVFNFKTEQFQNFKILTQTYAIFWSLILVNNDFSRLNLHMVSYMPEIRSFHAPEQKIYNSFNKALVTKYFVIVFASSIIHNCKLHAML